MRNARDSERTCNWEVPGTAHADQYLTDFASLANESAVESAGANDGPQQLVAKVQSFASATRQGGFLTKDSHGGPSHGCASAKLSAASLDVARGEGGVLIPPRRSGWIGRTGACRQAGVG
jgi:hypothetical protein